MKETVHHLGLLLLRVGAGVMLVYGHGWKKLTHFSAMAPHFADPLHVGSKLSLALAIFAEVFCALAVALGVLTRWAAGPVVFTMIVAAFIVNRGGGWDDKELALLYAVPFTTIMMIGPGRYALDQYVGIVRKGGGR